MTTSVPRRRNVRITVLLIVAIGTLVLVSSLLILMLSGRTALRNTIELLHSSAEFTIASIERDISNHVRPVEHIARHLAALVAAGEVDPLNRQDFITALKASLAAAPQVSGMAFWDTGGNQTEIYRDRERDGALVTNEVGPTTNEDLLNLLNSDLSDTSVRWRRPVHQDGFTFVYVAVPLRAGGEPLGLLAVGVALSELSKFVEKAGREYGMTAFILYGQEHVLAHPQFNNGLPPGIGEETPLLRLGDLDDGVLRQFHDAPLLPRAEMQGLLLRDIEWQDEDYLVLSRPNWSFGQTSWHIGVYAPQHTLDTQLVRLMTSIVAGIAVVVVAVIAAILLARYIARPILTLSASAEHIGRLELDDTPRLKRSRIKELDDQALAFNRMLDGLKWFETYVPKRLVSRLIAGRSDTSLGSREAELTVMFTDIIGFTAMSENMAPAGVGAMLNRHFEIISRCVEEEGGTIDKYIGDAVMAFWGAPDDQEDHAARACRAALRIAETVAQTSDAGLEAGHPPLRIKIAVHTGTLLVGNIGATTRMNYTVIGDTVNTCSRIESVCAKHDDGAAAIILVSGDTIRAAAGHDFNFTPIGDVELKGKDATVEVSRLSP